MPEGGGGTQDMVGTLIASPIPRVGICTNFENASSPRVGNFDQMRRRAVLVVSHVNELCAKKAAHALQDFGFGLIFSMLLQLGLPMTVQLYCIIYQLFKLVSILSS